MDDIETETALWQLVPQRPALPVIVTSRQPPSSAATTSIHVREFTDGQALALVQQRLGRVGEDDAWALVRLLGARPLALDHALRFLIECSDVRLSDLLQALAGSTVPTLDSVTPPDESHRSLVTLYRAILAPLLEQEQVRLVLDTFLAITGGYGASPRELLHYLCKVR